MIVFDNYTFWSSLLSVINLSNVTSWVFLLACFGIIFSVCFIFIAIFGISKALKPLISFLFIVAACASYYMDAYGTVFDNEMIQNITETTLHESLELLNINIIIHVMLFGLIPILFLYRINIKESPLPKAMQIRAISVVLVAAVSYGLVHVSYKDFTFVFRENREISFFINPVYPLRSVYRYTAKKINNSKNHQLLTVLDDAHLVPHPGSTNNKYNVLVLIVGETARAQSFSLNGYIRKTNPKLSEKNIVNYKNVSSCGTATGVSLPCMFSNVTHENFDNDKARGQQNLLDGLNVAGLDVLWVENNPDCKGICDRIPTIQEDAFTTPEYCSDRQCYDEALLAPLENTLSNIKNDTVIVLHTQGSHGPAYYRRYPNSFRHFLPECRQTAVQDCSDKEVINAYDNTILYTDNFISSVIDSLQKKNANLNTAMLYVSDHGESLGEKGVYLHGLPYFIAPEYQTKVPMVLWMSKSFSKVKSINNSCLLDDSSQPISHDYYFHSVLGLMDVSAKLYNAELDIFSSCRTDI